MLLYASARPVSWLDTKQQGYARVEDSTMRWHAMTAMTQLICELQGFGFIAPDDSNLGDLFVHVSESGPQS